MLMSHVGLSIYSLEHHWYASSREILEKMWRFKFHTYTICQLWGFASINEIPNEVLKSAGNTEQILQTKCSGNFKRIKDVKWTMKTLDNNLQENLIILILESMLI